MSKADIEKIKDLGKKLESSGVDYSEVTLRDIFTQAGLNSDLTERAIRDYQRYRESELSSLSILSGNDIRQIGAEALVDKVINLRIGGEIVADILKVYLHYLNYKKQQRKLKEKINANRLPPISIHEANVHLKKIETKKENQKEKLYSHNSCRRKSQRLIDTVSRKSVFEKSNF